MRVLSLELANFRNYAALRLEPPEGACVLVGANAQGKSNLLEALGMLAIGKSFRAAREVDLIGTGAPSASVSARVRTRHGEVKCACVISRAGDGARKRFLRNGRAVPYGQFLGGVNAVTFVPADLQLIAGPASLRRRLLNTALSQASRGYYRDLATYAAVLAQKNAFLRSAESGNRDLLSTYNDQLASAGARLVLARAGYVRRLAREAADAHANWVGPLDAFDVAYQPSPPQPDESPGAVERALRGAFDAMAQAELARRLTLVGPHRDDLALVLGGRALARFGSQGQQRTAVLAIKAGEYALARRAAGEAPLLLLDDVLSELDAARRSAFFSSVAGFEQAFISATEMSGPLRLLAAHVYEVRAGQLDASSVESGV